jgi:hypothetical protein
MDRFETVPDVREGASDDHAHGVIEVGLAHLVFEVDLQDFLGKFSHGWGFSGLCLACRLGSGFSAGYDAGFDGTYLVVLDCFFSL